MLNGSNGSESLCLAAEIVSKIKASPILSGTRRNRRRYRDIVCAFDIETSVISVDGEPESILYHWQFAAGDRVCCGRDWGGFMELIEQLHDIDGDIVVYVHNLSYEFQFLRSLFDFAADDVFVVKKRKILKAAEHNIEYRCSYLHSNMSLREYTYKMGVVHKKLSGEEFDYNRKRYPWTGMTDIELEYCYNDVLGLVEAVTAELSIDGDNLYTIPLTATGYVRRDAKKAMRHKECYIDNIMPNRELYILCRKAFRGGNTHANRYYAGQILSNVKSADRSSSYPDVQCNELFPVAPFEEVRRDIGGVERLIDSRGLPVIMDVVLINVRLRDETWGCPYISYSKCECYDDVVLDNGRVISAKLVELVITDIDYKILREEYVWDRADIIYCMCSRYGRLPRPLIDCTIEYYRRKTSLKGVSGQEIYYVKNKNKLNSIYGMMAQNPVKDTIRAVGMDYVTVSADIDKCLTDPSHRFLPYQWGVWVTAHARYRLEEGIRLAGDKYVYCDTDSVKYVGDIDWSGYNNERMTASKLSGAYANDPAGVTHYMGVYEAERGYDRFRTWGAKKYAGEVDGELEITIAGVSKRLGAAELVEAGGMEAFVPGYEFVAGGGTRIVYNDHPSRALDIDGGSVLLTSNAAILPTTYQVGITTDYEKLLIKSQKTIDNLIDFVVI